MQIRFLTLLCGLLLAISSVIQADDALSRIEPEESRMHVAQNVEVVFEVKHAKYSVRRKTAFLDSEENFQDEKNLGIAITEAGIQDLKRKRAIEGPADYYMGKIIRVTGSVILKEDKPYIEVTQAEQLDLVPQ